MENNIQIFDAKMALNLLFNLQNISRLFEEIESCRGSIYSSNYYTCHIC